MAAGSTRLVGPFGLAALLHGGLAALVVVLSTQAPAALPPIYQVDLVGAPPAPKPAEGIVPAQPTPPTPTPTPVEKTPPPPAHEVPPKVNTAPAIKAAPQRQVAKATPNPPPAKTQPVPKTMPNAASVHGGEGADVANVHIEGVSFPYPWYLERIVRQVALNFQPDDPSARLHAEVAFLIHRDGTVTGFRFIQQSGNYGFDLEAQGAIEKAGPQFGPLPQGFTEDVLPVVFSFDPGLIH